MKQLHQIKDENGKVLMERVVDLPDKIANELINPMTTIQTIKEAEEKFVKMTETIRDVIIDKETSGRLYNDTEKPSIEKWLKQNTDTHLFSNYVYGEPMLDLDEDKVKSHITHTLLAVFESELEEMGKIPADIENYGNELRGMFEERANRRSHLTEVINYLKQK